MNNLFLSAACATVLVGTLYPLALESLTGEKISVGPPFFNLTFVPLAVPLLLVVPFGQTLAWKRGDLAAASQRLFVGFALAIAVTLLAVAVTWGGPVGAPAGHRPRRLPDPRRRLRDRHAGEGQDGGRVAAPRRRPAALGLGHGRSLMPASASR